MKLLKIILSLAVIIIFRQPASASENLVELIAKGNSAYDRGQYDKAMDLYQDGLKASPKEAILFYNQANVLYKQQEYEEAINSYEEAVKNNPAKILLKNIYFNKANCHFKLAEKKAEEEAEELDKLKAVLAEYELAFEMYRKSIAIDREISIAEGRDIHLTGVYAKQNWALARERWTRTWERIRELEKKNLKLEDAISNLLRAETGMLPPLERFYLASFSEDTLKFSFKTLVQYHLDYQEEIAHLRELSAKEVEKIEAELENLKNAPQPATGSGSGPATGQVPIPQQAPANPELAQLEQEQQNIAKIQTAVDKAAELEEWTLDSLKRIKPIAAWKNSRMVIDLLQDLNSYLKKGDMVDNNYQAMRQELQASAGLLKEASTLTFGEEKGSYSDVKSRMIELVKAKLEMASQTIVKINTHLELLTQEINKKIEESESAAPTNSSDSPKEASPSPGSKDLNAKQIQHMFEQISLQISAQSLSDLIKRNELISQDIIAKIKFLADADPVVPTFETLLADVESALARYLTLNHQMAQLFAMEIKESETILDQLAELKEKINGEEEGSDESFNKALSLMDILLFKYQIMIDKIKEQEFEELAPLQKILPQNLDILTNSWNDFVQVQGQKLESSEIVEQISTKIFLLHEALLRNLLAIGPDTAITLYFERIAQLNERIVELLPATSANSDSILEQLAPAASRIATLEQLLKQYVESLSEQQKQENDTDKEQEFQYRKKAADFISRAATAGRDGAEMLKGENFLKADLLVKELDPLAQKAHLAFKNQPDNPQKIIETDIKLQEALKAQSRAASAVEASEGNSDAIKTYLALNQTDIIDLAGRATAKLRQKIALAKQEDQPGVGGAPMPAAPSGGGAAPPPQAAEPAALEEAIGFLQEAMIEAGKNRSFLDAREFDNTKQIHDQVIDLFQKALEALKQKKDDEPEQGAQCKNPQAGQDNEGDQGNEGEKKKTKPLELSPEEASALLNQLNKEDDKKMTQGKMDKSGRSLNTPRPW